MKYLYLFLLGIIATQSFGQETRIIKGFATDKTGGIYIGARVAAYKNNQHYVRTNMDGLFEISIPKKDKVVLQITYGCSAFYHVLYEVDKAETFIKIITSNKSTDRRTKKIRRKYRKAYTLKK